MFWSLTATVALIPAVGLTVFLFKENRRLRKDFLNVTLDAAFLRCERTHLLERLADRQTKEALRCLGSLSAEGADPVPFLPPGERVDMLANLSLTQPMETLRTQIYTSARRPPLIRCGKWRDTNPHTFLPANNPQDEIEIERETTGFRVSKARQRVYVDMGV